MTDLEESAILESVLRWETGKLTNHATDLGGLTKWGITWRTYSKWLKRTATLADMQALTRDTAIRIYRAWYIRGPGFSLLKDATLAEMAVHWGVMSGPDDAARGLQRIVGVAVDGVVGPVTAGAVNRATDPVAMRRMYRAEWERHCHDEVRRLPKQRANLKGWLNRIADIAK